MITIKTNLKNTNWLKYTIEQFKTINLAKFDIEIIGFEDKEKFDNVVFYTDTYIQSSLNIYNSNQVLPNPSIEYLKENLYIL